MILETLPPPARRPLISRLGVARRHGGFSSTTHWVWCGSVVADDQGRYHMFASRWSRALPFSPNWLTDSQIVRAVADAPEGPYEFVEVVFAPRGPAYWDGRMTHNPTIHRHGNKYLLFYTGTTYEGADPRSGEFVSWDDPRVLQAHRGQRIGLAIADHPAGPWARPDAPILAPRPTHWDSMLVSNPAPVVRDDGSVLLLYKSIARRGDRIRLGVAGAGHYLSDYVRLSDEPLRLSNADRDHVEDGYAWCEGGRYHLIAKDIDGSITGEVGAGFSAESEDGVAWRLASSAKAYSKTVRWDDGSAEDCAMFERPQLLIENGRPTHLVAAIGITGGPISYDHVAATLTCVFPLIPEA